jgi:hypothetical protein
VLIATFYLFAEIALVWFGGVIYPEHPELAASPFGESNYFVMNFNDFFSSMITLFALLVNNNWNVIQAGFVIASPSADWARVFFLLFYLIAGLITMNLVVALILGTYWTLFIFLKHVVSHPNMICFH